MIHITDGQNDKILSYIALGEFWDDVHRKSIKDNFETYDFTTFANKKFSQYLTKRNRVIIPDEDGNYAEFTIRHTRKYRSGSTLYMEVKTDASYLELKTSKVIYPETLTGQTAQTLVDIALDDTEWKSGIIHYKGIRTIELEKHTNPYDFLKAIASEFDLELNFRVVVGSNQVVARYVDLVERVGIWEGREAEFGTDLLGIERKEDTSNIVTALIGLGPEDANGKRMEVFVEDLDALRRWGRNGKHIVETYEPEFSSEENVTREKLETLTKKALKKRINSVVEYTGEVNDLENFLGIQNKKIRFGGTIKIKDTRFDPPLYLEARVHTQERSLSNKKRKKVTLGDYIEYTEEDVKAIWKKLQQEINSKLAKIVTVSIISSEGAVFKNGAGSTDLKALVYQGGKETDESGMAYEYKWDVFNKDGNLVTSIFTKQITVYAKDIVDVGTYVVTVSSKGIKMASSAITISNVFDGKPGPPGSNGKSFYTWIKYADDINGNGMSDTPDGKLYMGIAYNKTTPIGSSNPADYMWALIQGPQGVQGPKGSDGQTLYTWVKYADNDMGTGMSDSPNGKRYIGLAYNKTTPTEGTNPADYSWSLIQGPQGVKGTDGRTYYTWIKYADSPTSGMSDDPTGKKYMGIAYNKTTPTESANYADYSWSLIQGPKGEQGPQGPQGPQGIPGPKGSDGQTLYTWIKYADNDTGSGMSDSPTDKKYIGLAYNKTTAVESNNPADYTWSLIQGPQGVKGIDGKTYYTWIKYADDDKGNGMSDSPTGKKYMGIAYNKTTPTESNIPADYSWSLIQGPQGPQGPTGPQGAQGPQGVPGPKGADGQTLYTWIKYADNANGLGMSDNPSGKKYIGLAYNKTTPTESSVASDYTWSLIQGPQGVQGPKGADGVTTYTWVKYADDDKGNGMSDSPNGKRYLGLAYNKTTATESTNPTDYNWSPLYDNVKVGGRNLLLGTGESKTITGNNTINQCTTLYTFYNNDYSAVAGKEITLSFDVVASASNGKFIMQWDNEPWGVKDFGTPPTTTTHYEYTFTPPSSGIAKGIQIRLDNFSGTITISNLKLEKGNVATDWSPAPEDTQAEIDQAKEDAKNALMSADGKNTVFFQNTEPSKVGRKIGDLWFKTNEGNKIYRFDGSNWTPTPFGNAAIANLDVGKITANGIAANWLEAKHIKSLNGLNVGNGKFVVDQSGNVKFSGTLDGAKGTFSGDLESPVVVVGPKVASDVGTSDGFVGLKLKMVQLESGSDKIYKFLEDVVIKAINSAVSFGPSNYRFMFEGPLNAKRSLDVDGPIYAYGVLYAFRALYTYGDIYANDYKLIDYGTNYNGNYIRFANGVQICWHTLSTQWFVDTPLGNIYYSGSNQWTFPASFYSTPEVFVNTKSSVSWSWAGLGSAAATNYSMSYCVFSPSSAKVSGVVSLMSIGRWRE